MSQQITVNGEPTELAAATVAQLLEVRGVPAGRGIAVAVNGTVVPRGQYDEAKLAPGDRVEIIKVAVGG